MSDDKFDVPALVKEAREYADAEQAIYESAKIGEKPEERAGSNMDLFGELASALESLSARVTQAETTTEWGYRTNDGGRVVFTFADRRPYDAEGLTVVKRECLPWGPAPLPPSTGNEASDG